MKVVFKNRDFSNRVALPKSIKLTVDRYRWNQKGGPESATIRVEGATNKDKLMKLLRCPVEIWDEGKPLWWGCVNRITAPVGPRQRIGIGLDELYNYVTVAYQDGDTSAASDTVSIAEFGQKETRLNNINATQAQAEQGRDLWLDGHKYPIPEPEFSGGRNEFYIYCYGWYSTLGWKYYSDSDQTNTSNTTQISNIVTSAGQFLQGVIIEDAAGISSNEYRDGNSTALTYINQLLDAGTSNTRPLLATVDINRYLHVYERQTEPPTSKPQYLIRNDGKLITPIGKVVPDKECKAAVWAKLRDVPGFGGLAEVPPFFISSAEYDAGEDETTYKFADSYEQVRLARFVAEVVTGQSGGSGGGVYSPLPYTIQTDFSGLDYVKFTIDSDSGQVDYPNDYVNYLNYVRSRNIPVTYGDDVGYAYVVFQRTGLYFIGLTASLLEDGAGPTKIQAQLLSASTNKCRVFGMNETEGGSEEDYSHINISGLQYIYPSTDVSSFHISVGDTCPVCWMDRPSGQTSPATELDIYNSSFWIVRLGA